MDAKEIERLKKSKFTVMVDGRFYQVQAVGSHPTIAKVPVDCNGEKEIMRYAWDAIKRAVDTGATLM